MNIKVSGEQRLVSVKQQSLCLFPHLGRWAVYSVLRCAMLCCAVLCGAVYSVLCCRQFVMCSVQSILSNCVICSV